MKIKFTLFVIAAILLELLSVKAMADSSAALPNYDSEYMALGVFVCLVIFAIAEILRNFVSKIERLEADLQDEIIENERLRYALNDVVENFGENGMNFHRNTAEKLFALSRARIALGKVVPNAISV